MKKKLLIIVFLAFLIISFVENVRAQDIPEGIKYNLLGVSLQAGSEQLVQAAFQFQAFAINEVEGVEVRFFRGGSWSKWRSLRYEESVDGASELIFIPPTQWFELRSIQSRDLEVTLIDFQESYTLAALDTGSLFRNIPGQPSRGSSKEISSSSLLKPVRIITRRQWGANEDIGVYLPEGDTSISAGYADEEDGQSINICAPLESKYPRQYRQKSQVKFTDEMGRELIWPRRYSAKVKKIVIHHTAQDMKDLNGDGRINVRDYRLALRGIYTYHTQSRGWGDIGYHYIVDPEGNVYEGRAGGLNVVGAHVLCQNSNTIGIAVMGNFEKTSVPRKAFNGLASITKYVSDRYRINPLGKSSFRGSIIPNIVTHAEIGDITKEYIGRGATQCPGKRLKRLMSNLRTIVAGSRMLSQKSVIRMKKNIKSVAYTAVDRPKLSYELVSMAGHEEPLVTGEKRQVSVILKNTSNFDWSNEGQYAVRLRQIVRRKGSVVLVPKGIVLDFDEPVLRGEEISLTFDLPIQRHSGYLRVELLPMIGREKGFKGNRMIISLEVEARTYRRGGRRERVSRVRRHVEKKKEIPDLRVWLSEIDQDILSVSSPGKFIVWDSKSTLVRELNGGEVMKIWRKEVEDGTVFRLRAIDAPYLEFQNWDRTRVFAAGINDNTFRNVLEFRIDDGKMIVINELSLDDYMKGIAEVPESSDQPDEKRKVIAVLARSYAMHYLIGGYEKFPGKPYNAADNPAIFQKYIGYGFEQRSPKWQQALRDTAGEVVMVVNPSQSLEERVLRAAYFSCTDGHYTKTPAEAGWGGNKYFEKYEQVFQSIEDPLGDDPNRSGLRACGHQVGLSGYGATQMALQGKNYRDIIDFYYQGVEVAEY